MMVDDAGTQIAIEIDEQTLSYLKAHSKLIQLTDLYESQDGQYAGMTFEEFINKMGITLSQEERQLANNLLCSSLR